MTLKQIKDYFKETFLWEESISIGKIDKDKDKALCFYNSRIQSPKIGIVGGKKNRSYEMKPITLLLRYGTNADIAEIKVKEIYDFFDEREFFLDDKRVFVVSRYDSAIDLGTDDNGIYEYSFEFNVYQTNKE